MFDTEKEKLLDVLWENAIGGVALINKEGTFLRANPAFTRIVEYTEFELQRMNFRDITAPADVKASEDLSEELIKGNSKIFDMIKSYITKTGRLVYVHLRVVPFQNDDGEFQYFISQVFEVPVSIVRQMGISTSEQYEVTPVKPKIDWAARFRNWAAPMVAGLVGAGYFIQLLSASWPF